MNLKQHVNNISRAFKMLESVKRKREEQCVRNIRGLGCYNLQGPSTLSFLCLTVSVSIINWHNIFVVLSRQSHSSNATTSYLVATFIHSFARNSVTRGSGTSFQSVPVPIQTAVIVGVALRAEQVSEHASKVGDIGLGLEL